MIWYLWFWYLIRQWCLTWHQNHKQKKEQKLVVGVAPVHRPFPLIISFLMSIASLTALFLQYQHINLIEAFREKRAVIWKPGWERTSHSQSHPPSSEECFFLKLPLQLLVQPHRATPAELWDKYQAWLFPAAISLCLMVSSEDWMQTASSLFICALNKHLLSTTTYWALKWSLLGTENTKIRDKVQELQAQWRRKQVNNTWGHLGTKRGHPDEIKVCWRRSTEWHSERQELTRWWTWSRVISMEQVWQPTVWVKSFSGFLELTTFHTFLFIGIISSCFGLAA